MALSIQLDKNPGHWVVALRGDLDYSECSTFRMTIDKILKQLPPATVVDLSGLDYLDSFVLAQQTVVHEQTDQPVPDRTVYKRGGHRRVHPAAQAAQHTPVTDGEANLFNCIGHKRTGGPGGAQPGYLEQEVGEDLAPLGSVHDLGVELNAQEIASAHSSVR
jgi:hypothetical protein